MSMTLQDMVNMASANQGVYSSKATSPVSKALDAASQRISTQISQTNVRLSSYGQIQSGFASLQSAGKALSGIAANASTSDITAAAQKFVSAFNTTSSAISSATTGTGTSAGALANDQIARFSATDLHGIVTNGVSNADLQKIGISVNQNGSLSLDTSAFSSAMAANAGAVKSTLAKLGQQANTTATNELSSSGAVGNSVNALSSRVKTLTAEQTQQQGLIASQQASIQQHSKLVTGLEGFSAGISAYMQMFSL